MANPILPFFLDAKGLTFFPSLIAAAHRSSTIRGRARPPISSNIQKSPSLSSIALKQYRTSKRVDETTSTKLKVTSLTFTLQFESASGDNLGAVEGKLNNRIGESAAAAAAAAAFERKRDDDVVEGGRSA